MSTPKHISEVIVYRNGKRQKGCRVVIGFSGFFNNGVTKPFYTDSDGVARITHASEGRAEVFVDGKKVGEDKFPNRHIVYLK